ncbi:hypothetical protein [Cellvibrio mixtus]|uniref:hypothetical protein n=1 Tax=Cellvibrio mixtus TaxID=39650 RepID=UPI00113FE448|nr:hypothetical protein [Cellvibrio mixtus]
MKAFLTPTFTILLSLLPGIGSASSVCSGTIDMLLVTQSGIVEVYSSEIYGNSNGRNICNINTNWKSVTPDTCKAWYSTLLALAAQNKPAKIHYLPHETASCANVANYNDSVAPYAVNYSKN